MHVLFLAFGILSAGLAFAQTDSGGSLLACSAITSDNERLTCYDDLARAAAPSLSTSTDHWFIRTDPDPIDDSTNVYISTMATEDSSTSAYGDYPYLYLRCRQGDVAVLLEWQEYLGLDTIETTYRIGNASATTDTWYIGSTNQGAFYSLNEPANIDFINKLVNADGGTFVAQATPYGEGVRTAIFNISGLEDIVDQLFQACGVN